MDLRPTSSRYTLWKIFWVVAGVYLFFYVLGIIGSMFSPYQIKISSFFTWKKILRECVGLILLTGYFYVALNYFNKLIVDKKRFFGWLPGIIVSCLAVASYHAIQYFAFGVKEQLKKDGMKEEIPPGVLLFSYTFSVLFVVALTILIAYWNNLRDEKKQRKVLEEQKLALEVEMSTANFNFLKAQINPHFLHNTLNFLYAKSLPYSPELSEGILTLSDIMRYALSEGNAKDGKALLKDEIEHVRNVIKINQLRFSNKLNVQFDVEGVMNGKTIIPFVLITLVENAFKHGDLKTPERPIIIQLQVQEDGLFFSCSNKKKAGPKELSTGIGLDNIRKRLDMAYGNNYKMEVKDDGETYLTELTIDKL